MSQCQSRRTCSPGYRIGLLSRLNAQALSRILNEYPIGPGQIGVLVDVLDNKGISQDELTALQQTDRAATARALAALEENGLVRRHENPEDRRQKLAFPTAKAGRIAPALHEALDSLSAMLFRGFTRQERRLALELLDRMITNMQQELFGPERKR